MKKLFLVIALAGLLSESRAQEEFIEPARLVTRFNFVQLTGGVILMQGRLDPFPDTLNFIFDTGSGGISLDSSTAIYFGLQPQPSNRTIRGIGGIRNVSFLYNRTLHLPGLTVDSLNFHINNYQILTSVYGEQIDGIIGYSVISRYIIKVDYDSSKMEFWTKGAIRYPSGGFLMRPSINPLPVHAARVRDERNIATRFLVDLGAGLNMMLSTEFVRDSNVLRKGRKLYAKEAEGLGGKVDMHLTVVKEIRIGPYKFRNIPVYIFDDVYNVTSYPHLGGLIGSDLLRRFNITLNYEKRQIHLRPNGHFHDPFDYSYSGIELYYINGIIILGDVAAGSPAEKAGLKEGDQVIAINNDFSQSLQHYKLTLQSAGDRLKLIVMRNGQLMQFNFKVVSIIRR
ncbi:MAG TPA: aspartyl protease family protein [Flavisolibacter sp.]